MIKQRILYVGIGGTGLDLGIELDTALKREICGMDGNALPQKGIALPLTTYRHSFSSSILTSIPAQSLG